MAIINVKTKPEAPTKQPATIRAVFEKSTPAKPAAMPDNEFNNDITTGISPPPIGNTKANPANNEAIKKAIKTICINSKSMLYFSSIPMSYICQKSLFAILCHSFFPTQQMYAKG